VILLVMLGTFSDIVSDVKVSVVGAFSDIVSDVEDC